MAVTIHQIARLAGVNASTVSRVFNPNCGNSISKPVREKILAIAAKHEYVPKNSARSLARGKSFNFGIILHALEADLASPTFSLAFGEFCREAMNCGYQAVMLPVQDGDFDRQVRDNIRGGNADAYMIGSSLMGSETFKELERKHIPVVSYNSDFIPCGLPPNVCLFEIDNAPAFEKLFTTVKDRGFDRFILFGPKVERNRSRFNGYADSEKYGVHLSEDIEYPGSSSPVICWGEAEAAAEKYMKKIKACKLVLCHNDLIALGVCAAIVKSGLTVGRDVSVVGYDNIEENPCFDRTSSPFLATIAKDDKKAGNEMVKVLLRMLKGEKVPANFILPAGFIPRASLGYGNIRVKEPNNQ